MSDGLQSAVQNSRPLLARERAVIECMLDAIGALTHVVSLEKEQVVDLADGGMGSIRFVRPTPQRLGATISEMEYRDTDGVLVLLALSADEHDELFELDFWKVDFSPLLQYPSPSGLMALREPDRVLFSRSA